MQTRQNVIRMEIKVEKRKREGADEWGGWYNDAFLTGKL